MYSGDAFGKRVLTLGLFRDEHLGACCRGGAGRARKRVLSYVLQRFYTSGIYHVNAFCFYYPCMKKIITPVLAIGSLALAIAPVHAQATFCIGPQVGFN